MRVDDIKVHFPVKKGVLRRVVDVIRAVDGVSLTACARVKPSAWSGEIRFRQNHAWPWPFLRLLHGQRRVVFMGKPIDGLIAAQPCALSAARCRSCFRTPMAALARVMSIGDIVAEGLDIHKLAASKAEREQRG